MLQSDGLQALLLDPHIIPSSQLTLHFFGMRLVHFGCIFPYMHHVQKCSKVGMTTFNGLQVQAGKTYYVSLNGANYVDTFDLSIRIVPDIVDNPFVQVSTASHLSCCVI